jgi:hypothetical protein
MWWVSFLKPSDERKRGEAFRTIKISELNETIPLDVVHSLLAALRLHTTEVCSLQGCCLAGSDGVLLLRYFIHRQLLPLLVKTLCK